MTLGQNLFNKIDKSVKIDEVKMSKHPTDLTTFVEHVSDCVFKINQSRLKQSLSNISHIFDDN